MPTTVVPRDEIAQALWSPPAHTPRRPGRRALAFLRCLARQPLPVVLVDPQEVGLALALVRQGYVQAGRGGTGRQSALVVCELTPWARRCIACRP